MNTLSHEPSTGTGAQESGERQVRCPFCGYALQGLEADRRCPECGQTSIARAWDAFERRGRWRRGWPLYGPGIGIPLLTLGAYKLFVWDVTDMFAIATISLFGIAAGVGAAAALAYHDWNGRDEQFFDTFARSVLLQFVVFWSVAFLRAVLA